MISYPKQIGTITTRMIEAGAGPVPVVFVHGVSAYAHRWIRNLDALGAEGYRTYAFDLPGHGFATKTGEFDHSVPGYAEFLEKFLDAIGTSTAVLIGTSLGGHIAAAMACRRPERVRSLVLVGSLGIMEVGMEVRKMIAGAILNTRKDGLRAKLERAHAERLLVSDEWVDEEFRINNSAGAKETFERLAAYIGENLDEDCVGAQLASLSDRIPILLVWGEHDRSVAITVAHSVHNALPGSRLAVIRGAAHAPYFERPEAFNTIVGEFLSGALNGSTPEKVLYR